MTKTCRNRNFSFRSRKEGGSVCVFQLFSDIGPPRVEKLKVVEKCQKVESYLRNFTKLIYMAPIFRCFRGVRVRKVESRIYMDLIFRCFQGVRVQKVESRFYMGRIFRCFQGVRVRKVESRFTWTLFFGVFEGQRVKRQHFSASFGVSMTQRGKGVKV